jgi:hypothetical protein
MSKRTARILVFLLTAGACVCVLGAVLPHTIPSWARVGPVIWYTGGLFQGAALYALLSEWLDPGIHTQPQPVKRSAQGPRDGLESIDGLIDRYAYVHYGGERPAFKTQDEFSMVRPSGVSDCLWMLHARNLGLVTGAVAPGVHLIRFDDAAAAERLEDSSVNNVLTEETQSRPRDQTPLSIRF